MVEQQQDQPQQQQAAPGQGQQRREMVPATRAALENTEAFKGIFSFG